MQLSRHLSLEEFEHSDYANTYGIANYLPPELLGVATYTATHLFEAIRSILGDKPIKITSGFRNKELNKAIRGVDTSQHCLGEALDMIPEMDVNEAFNKLINDKNLVYDQLIREHDASGHTWIHASIKAGKNRQQIIGNLLKPS